MKRRILPLFLALGGCYGYYPSSGPTPSGRDVQLTLTDSGSVVLARQIGVGIDALEGRLTADSANTFVIALSSTHKRDGGGSDWKGERLAVPRPLVLTIEERRFSRTRTALFSTTIAVALFAVRQGFGGQGYSTPGSGLPSTGTGK